MVLSIVIFPKQEDRKVAAPLEPVLIPLNELQDSDTNFTLNLVI